MKIKFTEHQSKWTKNLAKSSENCYNIKAAEATNRSRNNSPMRWDGLKERSKSSSGLSIKRNTSVNQKSKKHCQENKNIPLEDAETSCSVPSNLKTHKSLEDFLSINDENEPDVVPRKKSESTGFTLARRLRVISGKTQKLLSKFYTTTNDKRRGDQRSHSSGQLPDIKVFNSQQSAQSNFTSYIDDETDSGIFENQSKPNFNSLPRRRTKAPDCTFHVVHFEKGPGKKSLGFTIVGGSDTSRGSMGIFVKSILPNGQAIDNEHLQTCDEILAVNGQSFQHLTHCEAVKFFKDIKCGSVVLNICRRKHSHESADIKQKEK